MEEGVADLKFCEEIAEEAAIEAGLLIREALLKNAAAPGSHQHKKAKVKSTHADLVTETDQECEKIIKGKLMEHFPAHAFIGEEEAAEAGGTPSLTEKPTWMVDPVDGTTNFVHGYPFVCVCIGLVVKGEAVLGIVYNPILDELFKASKGSGATLNGEPIHASDTQDLQSALVATEIGVTRDEDTMNATMGRVSAMTQKSRSMRMCGSCACNIVSIACGRLDGFYEYGFGGPWDVAAAVCILQEAGGSVLDPDGGAFNVMSRRVLATNGFLGQAMSSVLKAIPDASSNPS